MTQTMRADEIVLAITMRDDWLHAGTVREVLDHAAEHRAEHHHPGGPPPRQPGGGRLVDFFDADGRPVLPVLDDLLEVAAFARQEGPADTELRLRIERVLDRAQAFLDENPGGGPAARWPAFTSVPRPDGDLPDVVASLRVATTRLPNAHSGGWFHNLLHAMGG